MGIGVIIQARMGSSRLPGKSLMKLGSKPLIDHVIQRCLVSVSPNQVYLATTNQEEDKVLVAHVAETHGIKIFLGDKSDVRSRFATISKVHSLNKVVRITADDPFKDPAHIQESIRQLDLDGIDYYNNFETPVFPIGLDVESFRAKALYDNIFEDASMEHVTLGLRNSPNVVKKFYQGKPEFTKIRLTIDTSSDLEFCNRLLEVNPEMENTAFDWATTRAALIALGNY
jgi:spore coat polysaccharide biosynthesis protein SpsF (cytidylyltransferase family)